MVDTAAGSTVSLRIDSEAAFELHDLTLGFTLVDDDGLVVGGGLLPVHEVVAAGAAVEVAVEVPDVHVADGLELVVDSVAAADEAPSFRDAACDDWCFNCDGRAEAMCPQGVTTYSCECAPNKCRFDCYHGGTKPKV